MKNFEKFKCQSTSVGSITGGANELYSVATGKGDTGVFKYNRDEALYRKGSLYELKYYL